MAVEALRWRGDTLELLDQRILPHRVVYVTCRTAAEVAQAIREMVVRGAPAIGCAAAFGVALDAKRGAPLQPAYDALAKSRPTAVNLFWALERMRGARDHDAEARAIFEEDLAANRAMGRLGAELVPDGARVMTHCNAGALATAGHGTALGVIRSARDAGKKVSVIVNETRPYLQGARLTAWEMVQERIPVTLIADNMAGHLISRREVDLLIVGADRIAANGDAANKVGTYGLALAAQAHGVPFYVVAPVSTIDPSTRSGAGISIEDRDKDEVLSFGATRAAPEGTRALNPAFDVMPSHLITAIVTERGVLGAPYAEAIASLAQPAAVAR